MAALLFAMDHAAAFDLLLLDIYMPEQTGIEEAKELRDRGFEGSIIFLTTCKDHGVEATQYLVKPVPESRFHAVLDKIFQKIEEERRRFIAWVSEFEDFVPVGSIYLVNLGYVDTLTAKEITLTTEKKIYLPHGFYRALKEQYFKIYQDR